MAIKTVLGQVIIWCDKEESFDTGKITNIKNDELNYWGEIEKIEPPVTKFADGEDAEKCMWYKAKVLTDVSDKQLTPPHIFSGRLALSRAMDTTPENISFRWKYE
jgi:hypothetical protein